MSGSFEISREESFFKQNEVLDKKENKEQKNGYFSYTIPEALSEYEKSQ